MGVSVEVWESECARAHCEGGVSGIMAALWLTFAPTLRVQRAAAADEPAELNYIRKHASAMEGKGLGNAAARLFSNPAGALALQPRSPLASGA